MNGPLPACTGTIMQQFYQVPKILCDALPLPKPARWLIRGFRMLHVVQLETIRLNKRSQQQSLYLSGVIVAQSIGDQKQVLMIAKIVIITRILCDAIDQAQEMVKSCQRIYNLLCVWEEFTDVYIQGCISGDSWKYGHRRGHISLFFGRVASLYFRCCCLIRSIGEVIRQLWGISRLVHEGVSIVCGTAHAHLINDLFIELCDVSKKIPDHIQSLATVIEGSTSIDQIMKMMGVHVSSQNIAEAIRTGGSLHRYLETIVSKCFQESITTASVVQSCMRSCH